MAEENYRPTVLILDDEEMVTTSLRNLFRLQTDYRLVVHTAPERKLLEDANNHALDLVITDYLMPGMDGIRFSQPPQGNPAPGCSRAVDRLRRQGECDQGDQ